MKLNLREVYAYGVCAFTVIFGIPFLGDFFYTILHMIFIADHSKWDTVAVKYGEAIVKVVPMIIVAAAVFCIHWKMALKVGKSKK